MPALDFPTNPTNGQVYAGYTYDSAKTAWRATPTTPTISTTSDTPPSSPKAGDLWTDSRDGTTYKWWTDGTSNQWVQLTATIATKDPNPLPAGSIMAWGSDTIPANWLLCNGAAVSRTTYASLFAAIGTTYGVGDGVSTFNVPNLRGRLPMGKDSTVAIMDTLAETGGTLGLPVVGGGTATGYGLTYSDSMTTAVTNGASAIPPYVVMNYIIKTSAGETPGDSQLTTRVSTVEGRATTLESRATSLETRATQLEYNSPNYVINGGFDIWQRGTSFSVGIQIPYTADRWQVIRGSGTAGMTISRQPAGLTGFQHCMRVQRDSGDTNTTASLQIFQSFETAESIQLAGKPVTFSFYARAGANFSASGSTLNLSLKTGTSTDANVRVGQFSGTATDIVNTSFTLTSSWTRYSATATVPTNSTQLGFIISYTPTGTAGANDFFEIDGVQLEQGSTATAFRRNANSIQGELAACQRYYEKSYNISVAPGSSTTEGLVYLSSTSDLYSNILKEVQFTVRKRNSNYALTVYTQGGTNGKWSYTRSGVSTTDGTVATYTTSDRQIGIYINIGAAWTAGFITGHWVVDNEL